MKKIFAAVMFSMLLLPMLTFSDPGCSISAYTDKASYVPNERVYIYGSISDACENDVNADVAFEVAAPNKNKVFVDQTRTDENRLFSTSFVLPEAVATGTYSIAVSSKDAYVSKTFEVIDEAIITIDEITLNIDNPTYVKGEIIRMDGMVIIDGEAIADEEVAITVKDKSGNIAYVSQPKTDDNGTYEDLFRISASMAVGEYTAYASYGGMMTTGSFEVYPNAIINEVMYHPQSGDAKSEFIELYNPYVEDIDLDGYVVSVNGVMGVLSATDTILGPGRFALITADDSNVAVNDGIIHFEVGDDILGGLPDTSGTITLFDGDLNAVDSFRYRSMYGSDRDSSGVIDSDGEGASLERIDPYVLTNYYANWDSSMDAPTPGTHNTIYRGFIDSNLTFVSVDLPRYAMSQRDIDINTRVRNNADHYELVTYIYVLNHESHMEKVLLKPTDSIDNVFKFTAEPGDYNVSVYLDRVRYNIEGDNVIGSRMTIFEPVMNGSEIIRLFRAQLLAPAIVPRGNTFQVIPFLSNDYGVGVENIEVRLALPQSGGFLSTDVLNKTLALLPSGTFDASIVYTIQASSDIPDEMIGKRTISLYSFGTADGEDTWDATFRTIEVINHSSPVISLDMMVPENMVAGRTYTLVGAAFNTGTESAHEAVIMIDAPGLEVISDEAIFIDELEPSSFEMYSFDVVAAEGEHEIAVEIRDRDDNSHMLTKTVNVKEVAVVDEPESDDEEYSTNSGSGSGDGGKTINSEDIQEEDENAEPEAITSEKIEIVEFGDDENIDYVERYDEGIDDNEADTAKRTSPTGLIVGNYGIARIAAVILAFILIAFLVLNSKKIRGKVVGKH